MHTESNHKRHRAPLGSRSGGGGAGRRKQAGRERRMRSGRFCLQLKQGWMSRWFSLRLFCRDQSGLDWLRHPGPSALRCVMTECGPDRNLCCSLKGGSFGDYQGSWEWVVWHHPKVAVPGRELDEELGHLCQAYCLLQCSDLGQVPMKKQGYSLRRSTPNSVSESKDT